MLQPWLWPLLAHLTHPHAWATTVRLFCGVETLTVAPPVWCLCVCCTLLPPQAANANDIDGMVSLMALDGVYFGGGAPGVEAHGADGVRTALNSLVVSEAVLCLLACLLACSLSSASVAQSLTIIPPCLGVRGLRVGTSSLSGIYCGLWEQGAASCASVSAGKLHAHAKCLMTRFFHLCQLMCC
jgi:hypothetical protein